MVVGGAPTQQKLELADLAIDDCCQWCGQEVGTYFHRHWCCDGSRNFRLQYGLPGALCDAVAGCSGDTEEMALFERALYPDMRGRAPPPLVEVIVVWKVLPTHGVLTGRCCIDGAGLRPQDVQLCRAGWAINQIDRFGEVVAEAHGPLPGLIQHSGLGELFAFLMLLRLCMPPLVVVTDYQGVIDGVLEGRHSCTAANRKGADVWSLIWDKLEDIGVELIEFVKISSHKSRASVLDGTAGCTLADWLGNRSVDTAAKEGARLHPVHPDMDMWLRNAHVLTAAVARWIGTLAAHLVSIGSPDIQEAPAVARRRVLDLYGKVSRHQSLELIDIPMRREGDVYTELGLWQPRVLHCEAKNLAGAAAGLGQAERPTQSARPVPLAQYPSHEMRTAGAVVFCRNCGGYTSKRRSTLLDGECHGPAQVSNMAVKRLREGRHPVTNAFLGEVRRM